MNVRLEIFIVMKRGCRVHTNQKEASILVSGKTQGGVPDQATTGRNMPGKESSPHW